MTFEIQLEPSGHIIEQEGKETILRSGMRAGLNLAHNCINGSCGKCQGKLLKGELIKSRHHDFALNEERIKENYFLTCCHQPATDIVIEMHETNSVKDIPFQEIIAKVSKVENLTDKVISLSLRTSRSKVLDFLAGQKVQVCIDDESCLELAIASCPCDGLNLRFHLQNEGDALSERILKKLKKGQKLIVKGPLGQFTLDESFEGGLNFIAWNTSFAQVQSMIDHAISHDPDREIGLFWFADESTGHYLENYCQAWNDVLDNFSFHKINAESPGKVLRILSGNMNFIENSSGAQLYASLPFDMAIPAKELLIKNSNIKSGNIFFDIN